MYSNWISSYLEENPSPRGLCRTAVKKMSATFPELQEVRGHVFCSWGKRAHWWLKDSDGKIVDPTSSQFPPIERYEEWDPSKDLKIGRCLNCGDTIWGKVKDGPKTICSKNCHKELAESLSI